MRLFDTTLRDGGNVVGNGFSAELTVSMTKALLASGIKDIEIGNSSGLGGYEKMNATKAATDEEYFEAVKPYLALGRIGMFLYAKCADEALINRAAEAGLNFLRVGANAGDGASAVEAVKLVKKAGLICRYSLMKAYVLTPAELAAEAKLLQDAGVDIITIMDSAGYMLPEQATAYVKALKSVLRIPVGFHGHSNLGMSQANALAAASAGADEIDCGLLGLARSAGNCSTELAIASFKRVGQLEDIDLYALLDYLDNELIPTMKSGYDYNTAITPTDLILGMSGCHSSFLPLMRKAAEEYHVSLFKLITEVSDIDRKNPSEALIRETAERLSRI